MNLSELSKPYLALTRHPRFLSAAVPQFYLGPWCLKYPEASNRTLRTFDNYDRAAEAYERCDAIYEQLLPQLGQALNALHGTRHSLRYWRLTVGPWLYFFISTVYDRYLRLDDAYARNSDLSTIGLAEESFYTVNDSLEFLDLAQNDPYNLQLLSRIVKFLEKPLETRASEDLAQSAAARRTAAHRGWKVKLRAVYANTVGRVLSLRSKVFLQDAYFPKAFEINLMKQSRGRIGRLSIPHDTVVFPEDRMRRVALRGHLCQGPAEFDRLLNELIPAEIPTCFIEGYDWFQRWTKRNLSSAPETILSASAWCFNERFKFWAANAAENGTQLLGAQHGGNYQAIADFWWDRHEAAITDRLFCWGRVDASDSKRQTGPSVKWAFRPRTETPSAVSSILFVTTGEPRYGYQFPAVPEKIEDYLNVQAKFIAAFPPEVRSLFRVRILVDYFGWSFRDRLNDLDPNLKVEDALTGGSFLESLARSSLYVCDHLATTYAEALVANHPTVLFWDPKWNRLRPEAQPAFSALQNAGILFDDPLAAYEVVMRIHQDPRAWWMEKSRQEARLFFCSELAKLPSGDPFEFWYRQLAKKSSITGLKPSASPIG